MTDILDRRRSALTDRRTTAQLLIIGALSLPLACGEPAEPDYETLAIATTSLSDAIPTVPFSDTLVASGGDSIYTWSVSDGSLPTGLSLTASTGIISGTPSVEGNNTFTVEVASGDGQTDTQELTITVELPVLQPDELCSDYPDIAIATFEDANLESVIRDTLSLGAQDSLRCGLLAGLTELEAQNRGITSLVGIQNLTSLSDLDLFYNSITDISALSGLTSLTRLDLSFNSITDISALSGLTSLWDVILHDNSITDISAVSGLTTLYRLHLSGNSISDISAVSGLTSLGVLALSGNSIIDVSAVTGLTGLSRLDLGYNTNLTNIQPLLDNTGIGAGDTVWLWDTGVSCTDVDVLRARGAEVRCECP